MSNNLVSVNTERLAFDTSDINSKLTDTKREIKTIYENVQTLNGMWDGPANDEFAKQFESDYLNITKVFHNIDRFVKHLEECHRKYAGCENRVDELVNEISI